MHRLVVFIIEVLADVGREAALLEFSFLSLSKPLFFFLLPLSADPAQQLLLVDAVRYQTRYWADFRFVSTLLELSEFPLFLGDP